MDTTAQTQDVVTLTCPDCDGLGHSKYEAGRQCLTCQGATKVAINGAAIMDVIHTNRGGKRLRSSVTADMRDVYGAEYVWRMARFHGGKDVTMPVTCFFGIGCHGIIDDGAKAVLDALDPMANAVALEEFGTTMGAAARWAPLLGSVR